MQHYLGRNNTRTYRHRKEEYLERKYITLLAQCVLRRHAYDNLVQNIVIVKTHIRERLETKKNHLYKVSAISYYRFRAMSKECSNLRLRYSCRSATNKELGCEYNS